jgi:putative ABC transport system permease protein
VGQPPTGAGRPYRQESFRWNGVRRRLASFISPPWVKAPLLLLRFRGLLLAILAASFILAVASGASSLFLSSAGNATLAKGVGEICPASLGVQAHASGPVAGQTRNPLDMNGPGISASTLLQMRQGHVATAIASIPRLGPLELSILGPPQAVVRPSVGRAELWHNQIVFREGALSHIQQLTNAGGDGVWITDTTANALHVAAGNSVSLHDPFDPTSPETQVRVAGTYRDLATIAAPPFWCTLRETIYPVNAASSFAPPPLMVADFATFTRLVGSMHYLDNQFLFEYPLRTHAMTVAEAQVTGADISGVQHQIEDPRTQLHALFDASINTDLPTIVDHTAAVLDSVRSPIGTVSLAARIVGLVVIAAAGLYWVDRRRVEVAVLSAKGAGAAGLSAKIFLETMVPAAVGAGLGWVTAIWIVRALGPGALLDAGTSAAALRQVAVTALVAVALLSLVGGLAGRRDAEGSGRRERAGGTGFPWEIAVLALAAASLYEILTRGSSATSSGSTQAVKVDWLLLLFPILFLAGTAGLVTRGLRRLFPRFRMAANRSSPPVYLASRRLAGASRGALALITAVALSIGILAYAGMLAASVTATSRAKALVFTGADVNVSVGGDFTVPPSLAASATRVIRVSGGANVLGYNNVDLLGVDRSTFARAAFWDKSFSGRSLSDLLRALAPGSAGSPIPIVATGDRFPRTGTVAYLRGLGPTLHAFRTVASVKAFPGLSSNIPLVVMDQSEMPGADAPRQFSLWAKGSQATIDRAVKSAGLLVVGEQTASEVQGLSDFRVFSWAFGFLQALGVMTGLIALGGVLLYLEARQRAREVSYALSRRMGLKRGASRRSIVIELGGMLMVGFVLGAGLSWVASRIVYGKLDPMPALPPPPIFRVPTLILAGTAGVLLVVSVVGAWRVQRAAERADMGQVMRLGA